MDKYSLRRQVVIVTTVLIISIVFIYTTVSSSRFKNFHIDSLKSKMSSQALLISDILFKDNEDIYINDDFINKVNNLSGTTKSRISIVDYQGIVVADSKVHDLTLLDNHLNRKEILDAEINGVGDALRHSDTLKTDMLYYALKVSSANAKPFYIRLAIPLSEIDSLLKNLMVGIMFIALFGVVVLIILNSLLIKSLVNPLESVNEAFNELANGRTGILLNIKPSNTETKQLIKSFNNMSLQIRNNIKKIEHREMELNTLITSMVNGIIFIDEKGYVKVVNPAARKLLSYVGTLNAEYVTVVRNTTLIKIIEETMNQRDAKQYEIKLNSINDEHILQVISVPLYSSLPSEEYQGIMLLLHDITAMRHIEQTRKDLIANVSHELRTPITSIAGFVETILDMDEDDENIKDFLNIIFKETERLKKLIDDLLELAKLEAGQLNITIGKVCVADATKDVLTRYAKIAKNSEISIKNNIKDSVFIKGDLFRFEQILDNIISNAIKYTPKGGSITISSKYLDDSVIIKILDTGYGIESSKLHRITEQFYRTDRGRARASSGGYGLGLAIVKNLVEAQGGMLQIKSELGHGTEVSIILKRF